MIVAEWKRNIPYSFNADAQKVANEILSIGDSATAEQIVEKAKDDSSELHKCFEWDDSIAAYKYRVQQARMICCSLIIKKREDVPESGPSRRAFYVTQKGEGYKSAEIVFKNEDEYSKLLRNALAELHAFKMKYASLKELSDILALID